MPVQDEVLGNKLTLRQYPDRICTALLAGRTSQLKLKRRYVPVPHLKDQEKKSRIHAALTVLVSAVLAVALLTTNTSAQALSTRSQASPGERNLIRQAIALAVNDQLDAAETNIRAAMKTLVLRVPDGAHTAQSHNILGVILERQGKHAAAESEYRTALAIMNRNPHRDERSLVDIQTNLALLLIHKGQMDEALVLANARAASFEGQLRTLLKNGDEEQARTFIHLQNPFSTFASIGQAGPIAKAVFNYQNLTSDAMAALLAQRRRPAQRDALERWRRARSALTQTMMAGRAEKNRITGLKADLSAARNAFVRLAQDNVLPLRFDVRTEDISQRIAPDAALLNYVRYSQYLGNGKWQDHFGVVTLTSGGAPHWIALPNAADIEGVIDVYGRAVRGRDPVNSVPAVLSTLYEQLLAPVVSQLSPTVKHLLIVPDGELNLVSFATLLDQKKRLVGEQYAVSYLSSARALLERGARTVPRSRELQIYADPHFGLIPQKKSDPLKQTQEKDFLSDFHPAILAPLPFTELEATVVKEIADRYGWHTTVLRDAVATEGRLRSRPQPAILHLATHGLWLSNFLNELTPVISESRGVAGVAPMLSPNQPAEGPPATGLGMREAWMRGTISKVERLSPHDPVFSSAMQQSAVALSGAQDTLTKWKNGHIGKTENDGILTAEEAAMLDLSNTWLVAVSSCDSGIGEAAPGEGTEGLRRGFIEAGAQNVLTALWPVSDAWTPKMMADFYAEAFSTNDAGQSLAMAQRKHLIQLRKQYGLEAAVRLAGAFILTSHSVGTAGSAIHPDSKKKIVSDR
jgi:CHAT domain-containing protein